MAQWLNFAEIRARVSLAHVLFTYYKIDTLTREGSKVVGPCPVHHGDSPRAFHADLDKGVWHCFSKCQRGGNQLDFVVARDKISVREAALRLSAFFLGGAPTASPPPTTAKVAGPPAATPSGTQPTRRPPAPNAPGASDVDDEGNPVLDVTLELKGDHPHLVNDRKLSAETIKHFGVGYCSRGILRGMIAIPIHDGDGDLVAYAGRRLKPGEIESQGKYRLPKGFRKEIVLFNLHRAMGAGTPGLILVEGFFSVLKLHDAGFKNVVASMGCEVSASQVKLLAKAKEVVVIFDGNEAGWSGAQAARDKLSELVPVRVVRLPAGLEPEDLPAKALRWLVNGMTALDLAEVSFELRRRPPAAAS